MRKHIENLCLTHDIYLVYDDRLRGGGAFAVPKMRLIKVPNIKSKFDYIAALHEIGHIIGKRQRSKCTLSCEVGAWEYAMQESKLKWTRNMRDMMQMSLWSYLICIVTDKKSRKPSSTHPIYNLLCD